METKREIKERGRHIDKERGVGERDRHTDRERHIEKNTLYVQEEVTHVV